MAACTIAWLGPADEDSNIAMAEIGKIGAYIENHEGLQLFFRLEELSRGPNNILYEATKNEIFNLMSAYYRARIGNVYGFCKSPLWHLG
ncbi:MAG: hypothetical protein LQ342_002245 [Letrouitia transgressa]|nr:MAG: hypothetical protein LQ342_002245 [Letrouitia transgressa]